MRFWPQFLRVKGCDHGELVGLEVGISPWKVKKLEIENC